MENTQADEGWNGPGGHLETFARRGGLVHLPTLHSRSEQRGRQRLDILQRSTCLSLIHPTPLASITALGLGGGGAVLGPLRTGEENYIH